MSARDTQIGGDHYKQMAVEPWDVVDSWPIEQRIGYFRGCALKYVMRLGSKDAGAQEARKAAHYLEKLAETLEMDASKPFTISEPEKWLADRSPEFLEQLAAEKREKALFHHFASK